MRTITVKGTGNVSARPDYIVLSLNIEALSETYDRAMADASERIKKLQDATVIVGYEKSDLKTVSFNVQTRYENIKDRQGNYKREFAGYACKGHFFDCELRGTARNQYCIHCEGSRKDQRKTANQRDGECQNEGRDSLQSIRQYAWAATQ